MYVGDDIELGLFEKYRCEVSAGPGILRWCESRVRVGSLRVENDEASVNAFFNCLVQTLPALYGILRWLVLGGSSVNVKTRPGLRLTLMMLQIWARRISIYQAKWRGCVVSAIGKFTYPSGCVNVNLWPVNAPRFCFDHVTVYKYIQTLRKPCESSRMDSYFLLFIT